MDDAKTPSHIERVSEDDIEKILETEQIPKFGERFRQYRQQYIETIAGIKTASGVQSPITLGIELLNSNMTEIIKQRNESIQQTINNL